MEVHIVTAEIVHNDGYLSSLAQSWFVGVASTPEGAKEYIKNVTKIENDSNRIN